MAAPSQPADAPLHGRTVLVVEDSAAQRAHVVAAVRELGAIRILEAANGLEGLAQLAQEPAIDLLLSDLEMPEMDGVTFIGDLAARGYRPQVVIVSAHDAAVLHAVRLMAETYALTVLGTLPKPLTCERLAGLLKAPHGVEPPSQGGEDRDVPGSADIRQGLEKGEFFCFFQPQVTFQGTHFKAAEALVRWRHPSAGLLGPAAFLPQAEAEEGLMTDLTLAILADVARQWHGWRTRGLELEISVNLSARSLSAAGCADRVLNTVEQLGLNPKALVFEVTESASVAHLGHTLANLARLRMRGFRLSIDDFGTGFATFEQLERIPFTELKLDRSIVMHLGESERHVIVARRILEMARDLKLATVAEGIETIEQWAALKSLGCERGQGYFIGRPMPSAQLGAWASQSRAHLRAAPSA